MKNSPEIKKIKGNALSKRIDELRKEGQIDVTGLAIGKVIGRSRDAIAKYKSGESWPSQSDETAIENHLRLPNGFFRAIAKGVSYENAMLLPITLTIEKQESKRLQLDYTALLAKYSHEAQQTAKYWGLLSLPPPHTPRKNKVQHWQTVLSDIVDLSFDELGDLVAAQYGASVEEREQRVTEMINALRVHIFPVESRLSPTKEARK